MIYPTDPTELTAAERTLHLALRLLNGEEIVVRQAAIEYETSRPAIYRSLDTLSLMLPVDNSRRYGIWRLLTKAELEDRE